MHHRASIEKLPSNIILYLFIYFVCEFCVLCAFSISMLFPFDAIYFWQNVRTPNDRYTSFVCIFSPPLSIFALTHAHTHNPLVGHITQVHTKECGMCGNGCSYDAGTFDCMFKSFHIHDQIVQQQMYVHTLTFEILDEKKYQPNPKSRMEKIERETHTKCSEDRTIKTIKFNRVQQFRENFATATYVQ